MSNNIKIVIGSWAVTTNATNERYNFTEHSTKYRVTQEIIQKVQRQSRKKTAYNKNLCSYKLPSLSLFFLFEIL